MTQIHVSHKTALAYLIIVFATFVSLLTVLLSNSDVVCIAAVWMLGVVAMLVGRFDISHPYVWFPAGLCLYSTSYAILHYMGLQSYGLSRENLLYPVIALSTFLLIVGPRAYHVRFVYRQSSKINNQKIDKLCVLFFIVTLLCDVYFVWSGFLGKSLLKAEGDIIYRACGYITRYLCMFIVIKLCYSYSGKEKPSLAKTLLYGVPIVLFGLFTGERDAYLRYFVAIIFCMFFYGKLTYKHLLVLIPVSVVLLSFSVVVKYYFSSEGLNLAYQQNPIIVQFLQSDFSAAGRNLQVLINTGWTNGSQGWGVLFSEVISVLLPSGIMFSPDKWYNYEVFPGTFRGNAFTLIGTGYIIDGVIGIIAVFVIIALVVRWLYKRAEKNATNVAVYIYMSITVILSLRQSLSSIGVAYIRIVIVSLLIVRWMSLIKFNSLSFVKERNTWKNKLPERE